jgi:hypothetical protein
LSSAGKAVLFRFADDDNGIAATVMDRLERIQYRPALINGFLAQTARL